MPGELIPIVLFISMAAVAIFRPLTIRLGRVIDRSHAQKVAAPDPQTERLMELMERLVDRVDRLEDRVDFTEHLLERQRGQAQLTQGGAGPAQSTHESSARTGDDSASR